MKLRVLFTLWIATVFGLIGCTSIDDDDAGCTLSKNCKRLADGEPVCMDGFEWANPNDADSYECVPLGTAGAQPGSTTPGGNGSTPGTGGTGGTGGDNQGNGGNDGCPPNSHREGDSCFCDEGFVVNDAENACIEGESSGGSGECPPNSHLQGDSCYCDEGYSLSEDRTACIAECETDSDCSNGQICEDNNCREPRCTEGSCPNGTVCDLDSGYCIQDIGTLPPEPNLNCNVLPAANCAPSDTTCIPSWQCTGSDCGNLVAFNPRMGNHYWDYEINGETASNQYRSFIRGDVRNLVRYSSAWVRCMTHGRWEFGNDSELALGDMSESNGDIPGTSIGSAGHPPGTHVSGSDMDIGYYQTQYSDNRLRPICEHTQNGTDQYHCIGSPNNLDIWRSALVLAKMHDNPNLRVIGVDGQAGLVIESAISQMCSAGWISGGACNTLKVTWEVTDGGAGWFRFHHHHFHISVSGSKSAYDEIGHEQCLDPRCSYDFREDPRHLLYPTLRSRIKERP